MNGARRRNEAVEKSERRESKAVRLDLEKRSVDCAVGVACSSAVITECFVFPRPGGDAAVRSGIKDRRGRVDRPLSKGIAASGQAAGFSLVRSWHRNWHRT
jgi:hypothetical protein